MADEIRDAAKKPANWVAYPTAMLAEEKYSTNICSTECRRSLCSDFQFAKQEFVNDISLQIFLRGALHRTQTGENRDNLAPPKNDGEPIPLASSVAIFEKSANSLRSDPHERYAGDMLQAFSSRQVATVDGQQT
ncbi:hypothetical protein ACFPGO_05105 [Arcanobacterium canis]|uniref:Uncharacterized protein n=1 Tax=Arcanobacterium canis TaxID=999183 RepID=A0ABY8G1X7_9ACTO|nr:hypothetical protein [Arcanobacterium canis]WFM83836.1 hypothetical protein P7079_02325 [Arcanobacterium canis]